MNKTRDITIRVGNRYMYAINWEMAFRAARRIKKHGYKRILMYGIKHKVLMEKK